MKKEVKIILVSGVAITIKEEDKIDITMMNEGGRTEINDVSLEQICGYIISKENYNELCIKHKLATEEYMEYYLTRDKITWCYYSETKEDEKK